MIQIAKKSRERRRQRRVFSQGLLVALSLFVLCGSLPADDTALYWSISRNGEPVGRLLGTIHSEDPRVLDFPDPFVEELTSHRVFAMEMVPNLPTLARLTDYMHYQDGSLLAEVVGMERFERLQHALSSYSMPPGWVDGMKVWAAVLTLSVPPSKSGFFMDLSLSLRAAGAGLQVIGLETLEQQLAFLEEMPLGQQLELLDHALVEHERVEAVHVQLVDSYLQGDLVKLEALSNEQMTELSDEAREYFLREGIDERNRRMLESMAPELAQGGVFVAVGALHLPGENGLVSLLRAGGYDLEPLPMPFLTPE
ncbi:MAG: TraB/GumN family protein [Gammaproteobacteria bacterium]|nr:TraB/GumN family protein [Gammaproteobacteria bacterium]